MSREIKTFDFKTPSIGIEVKDLGFIKEYPKLLGKPHKTVFYQMAWISEGEATFRIDFREVRLKANEVLIISAGQVCKFDLRSDYSGKMLLFTSTFFSITEQDSNFLYTSEILNPINLNRPVSACPLMISKLFSLLEEELKVPPDSFKSGIAQSYLRVLLLEAERRHAHTYPPMLNYLGRKFYYAVEQHYKKNKNTDFYIRTLGVNEKTLSKEIKALTGKTPKAYIDSRVILEAKRLLSYSNLSVKEIGVNLGFDEPSNFNKYFRKNTNQTPIEFRISTR